MLSFRFSHLKFRNDLEWNLLGFAVIAICGLLINILIIWFYDFSFLGFFNLLLIFFLVLSQITSWGVGPGGERSWVFSSLTADAAAALLEQGRF